MNLLIYIFSAIGLTYFVFFMINAISAMLKQKHAVKNFIGKHFPPDPDYLSLAQRYTRIFRCNNCGSLADYPVMERYDFPCPACSNDCDKSEVVAKWDKETARWHVRKPK